MLVDWAQVLQILILIFLLLLMAISVADHYNKEGFESPFMPLNTAYAKMPVKQYLVKSSFDSAVSAGTVSTAILTSVIKDGCRFLDFNVSYGEHDGKKTVQVGNDEAPEIPFHEIIHCVAQHAFAVSNGTDPLFLHFRIASILDAEVGPFFDEMGSVLQAHFGAASGKNIIVSATGETKLSDLIGKVVCIIHKNGKYDSYKEKYKEKTIHIESGTKGLKCSVDPSLAGSLAFPQLLTQPTTPPVADGNATTVDHWQIVFCKDTSHLLAFIRDYGVQIIAIEKADFRYNTLFKNSAFLTLTSALSAIDSL